MKKYFFYSLFLLAMGLAEMKSQNVGINATGAAPSGDAGLDVNFTNKGVLIPRVNLSSTTTYGLTGGGPTTSMLVYNNNAGITGPGAASEGFYYWRGSAGRWVKLIDNLSPGNPWLVGGNNESGAPGTAYNFGHIGDHHIDFITNGLVRGRLSNLGEFFIGTTNTTLPGDLMNGVSNSSFPWALNGYSDQNGSGVYGSITAGNTIFGAVQGEYNGTNSQGTGVRGIYLPAISGLNFGSGSTFPALASGINGKATSSGNYKFGVYGQGGTSSRSGGVIGADYGIAMGALGYYTSGGADVAVYGFGQSYTTGSSGGKILNQGINNESISNFETNNMIGLGIYGGVMGGWIKGLVYGTNVSGKRYGLYVHGKTITNNIIATLHNQDNTSRRIPTYAAQSMKAEVSEKGKVQLINGYAKVKFSDDFAKLINKDDIIINITPLGPSKGLYVAEINRDGFVVRENMDGISNISFFYVVTASLDKVNTSISEEILDSSFEEKIDGPKGVMYNDSNPEPPEYSLWWDGSKIRFDIPNIVKDPGTNLKEACRLLKKTEKNK